jgi:hypothetical protein
MTMFKPPSKRVRIHTHQKYEKPVEGTFLYDIITPTPPDIYAFKKAPIYEKEQYLKELEKNHKRLGIPYVKPDIPDAAPRPEPEKNREPNLEFGDRVYVDLKVLKSGIVRVKVKCAIAMMYEKYYKQAKQPPFKTILQAYKSHGFSQTFLDKIKKSHEKKLIFAKKVPGILEKIFDKEPVKKPKKEKKKKEPEEEEVPDEEEEEPIEEGEEMDVEPDEEEVVEEEEYFSEPET